MQLDTATGAWVYKPLTQKAHASPYIGKGATRSARRAQARLRTSQPKISPWVFEVAAA